MAITRKIVLIVEYDGTDYCGFQYQLNQPTVQDQIETALLKLTGEKKRIIAASRTDSGVHARGQVVSFRTESELALNSFVMGLNYHLPEDIAVQAAYGIGYTFDIRKMASSREYQYSVLNRPARSALERRYAYHVGGELDIEAMHRACQALVGEHDFASFASRIFRVKTTVRRMYQAETEKTGDMVVVTLVANAFLPHQVRSTVGTLLQIGRGAMNLKEFYSIIEAKTFGLAGPVVPACGLCLMKVNYPASWGEYSENI